jgi:hypothetical protein
MKAKRPSASMMAVPVHTCSDQTLRKEHVWRVAEALMYARESRGCRGWRREEQLQAYVGRCWK